MFQVSEPSQQTIQTFLASQRDLNFSYDQVGATNDKLPSGFTIDHNRIKLGDGQATYARAVSALCKWKQFDLGWLQIVPADTPIEAGAVVAVKAHTFGFWSLNACRIVYVIDERLEAESRFGFAYGTLPDHVERGEERFTVQWQVDNSVWYDILAFSRPQHPLVKAGFPVARMLQKRFARESLAAMMAQTV
jgi:uncharacterized protein (UPF0548 family)